VDGEDGTEDLILHHLTVFAGRLYYSGGDETLLFVYCATVKHFAAMVVFQVALHSVYVEAVDDFPIIALIL